MDTLLRTLMGPWTTSIAWLLGKHGRLRFGELKAQAPASSAEVLTERLRHLEASGLVDRDHQPTIPPPSTTPSSRAVWNCTPCSTA